MRNLGSLQHQRRQREREKNDKEDEYEWQRKIKSQHPKVATIAKMKMKRPSFVTMLFLIIIAVAVLIQLHAWDIATNIIFDGSNISSVEDYSYAMPNQLQRFNSESFSLEETSNKKNVTKEQNITASTTGFGKNTFSQKET